MSRFSLTNSIFQYFQTSRIQFLNYVNSTRQKGQHTKLFKKGIAESKHGFWHQKVILNNCANYIIREKQYYFSKVINL